jgi:hypothetical protein
MGSIESLLEEERTYNSAQLAQKLEAERAVKLSPAHLRRVLKKSSKGDNPLLIYTHQ